MDEIFKLWPSLAQMASDLGLKYQTVASWRQRGIPAKHDYKVVAAAKLNGKEVTLLAIAEARQTLILARSDAA